MAYDISAHIFDIDEWTAEQMTRRIIRKRRFQTAVRFTLVFITGLLAVGLIALEKGSFSGGKLLAKNYIYPIDNTMGNML